MFEKPRKIFAKGRLGVYFCFEFSAGRIYAASVSLGDQVIVFGGHLGHIKDSNGQKNLGPTNLIGSVLLHNGIIIVQCVTHRPPLSLIFLK